MPFRIPVAGMTVSGMPGVATAIDLMRVVASAIDVPPSTEAMPATAIAMALHEVAVAAVAVRRIVVGTIAVVAVMLGLGERAEGEDEC